MAIATHPEQSQSAAPTTTLTSEHVWREIDGASFAILGYVTPAGEPRSSGVVYKSADKRLYVVVARTSWKARHIAANSHVSVTVPVRRGGIIALVAPIPPATISFHAKALVHPAGSVKTESLSKQLESLVSADRRDAAVLIELIPEGRFVTYGIGISLMDMQKPELAEAVVPIGG